MSMDSSPAHTLVSGEQESKESAYWRNRYEKHKGRTWTGVIAVVVLASWAAYSWSVGSRDAITKVLVADRALSREADQAVQRGADRIPTYESMVQRMQAISLSDCPSGFADAYIGHCQAWQRLVDQVKQEPQSFLEGVWTGALNSLGGELDGGMTRLNREHRSRVDELKYSWERVLAEAKKHDVSAPP